MSLLALREYLAKPLQVTEHFFSKKKDISFHWADFSHACQLYRDSQKKGKKNINSELTKYVNTFHNTDLWMKASDRVVTLSLYQIYDCLISNTKLPVVNKGKDDLVEVCFMGPGGPFKKISLGECVNDANYAHFVFLRLMDGTLPMRDFRIRCQGKVLCYYEQVLKHSCVLEVSQLTSEGILFVSSEKNLESKLSQAKNFRPLIDIKIFKQALGASLNDLGNFFNGERADLFYTHDERCEYNINPKDLKFYSGYDSQAKGVDYIFCRYEDIKGHNNLLEDILKSFTQELKSKIYDVAQEAA